MLGTLLVGGSVVAGALFALDGHSKNNDYFTSDIYELRLRWQQIFYNTKIYTQEQRLPQLIYSQENELGHLYKFDVPVGLDIGDFEKNEKAFRSALGSKLQVLYKDNCVHIQTYEKPLKKKYTFLKDYIPKQSQDLEVVFGVIKDEKGERPAILNLTGGSDRHMFIAGRTNGGKSKFLKSLIYQCGLRNDITMWLTDLKQGEELHMFTAYDFCERYADNFDMDEVHQMLLDAEKEMMARAMKIRNTGFSTVTEYNEKNKHNKIKHMVLVIEEMATLVGKTKIDGKRTVNDVLKNLVNKARSTNIVLIFTTQRPDADTVDGSIKAQTGIRVCFYVNSELDARIAYGNKLPSTDIGPGEPGRGLIRCTDYHNVLFHGFYIKENIMRKELAHKKVKPKPKAEPIVKKPKESKDLEEKQITKQNSRPKIIRNKLVPIKNTNSIYDLFGGGNK